MKRPAPLPVPIFATSYAATPSPVDVVSSSDVDRVRLSPILSRSGSAWQPKIHLNRRDFHEPSPATTQPQLALGRVDRLGLRTGASQAQEVLNPSNDEEKLVAPSSKVFHLGLERAFIHDGHARDCPRPLPSERQDPAAGWLETSAR